MILPFEDFFFFPLSFIFIFKPIVCVCMERNERGGEEGEERVEEI